MNVSVTSRLNNAIRLDAGRPRLLLLVSQSDYFLSHRLPLALAAQRAGYDVHLITRLVNEEEEITQHGVALYPVDIQRGLGSPWHDLQTVRLVRSIIRQLSPEILHCVSVKSILLGNLAARGCAIPAVVNAYTGLGGLACANESGEHWGQQCIRMLLRCALKPRSWSLFQNPDDLSDCLRWQLADANRSVLIRSSGVDTTRFRPGSWPRQPTVMMAGRLIRSKGVLDFVEMARMASSCRLPMRFVLVGEPDSGSRQQIGRSELMSWSSKGILEWWGRREDMHRVLPAATVVVSPSVYGEGVPKILLEAAACGRPLVANDIRGCREIVMPGDNGWLVPPGQPATMLEAVMSVASSPEIYREFGAASRRLVEQHFSADSIADQTLQLYDRCRHRSLDPVPVDSVPATLGSPEPSNLQQRFPWPVTRFQVPATSAKTGRQAAA